MSGGTARSSAFSFSVLHANERNGNEGKEKEGCGDERVGLQFLIARYVDVERR